jgi:hypothetical protein
MSPNKVTGANAGGPRQSPMRTRWAARVAQFRRSHEMSGPVVDREFNRKERKELSAAQPQPTYLSLESASRRVGESANRRIGEWGVHA